MTPGKQDNLLRGVVAVREDEEQPVIIPQQFQLRVLYSQAGLLLFRLDVSFAGSASTQTTIYLQFTADFLDSLDHTVCDKADANVRNPQYLDSVRRQLGGMHSITRLQFQLAHDKHIQLVVPKDFTIDKLPDDTARSTFEYAESLAASSMFSLYFQHDILCRKSVAKYKEAIRRSKSEPTDPSKKQYERMRDMGRLYVGVGGKEHKPRHHPLGLPPTRDHCSPPAPGTPSSYGSTVPFDDVPRGSPPSYTECSGWGLSPRATSGSVAIFALSPGGDCDPPGYGDAKRRDDALDSSQGVFPRGNEDIDIRPTTKRKRSYTTVCITTTSATDAPGPEESQRSPFPDASDRLMRMLHEQQLQIQRLQQMFEESQRRNEKLEQVCEELEGRCSRLENRQADHVEIFEDYDVEVDDLKARCHTLERQMPDVCDEMEDLKDQWLEEFREEFREESKENGIESSEENMLKRIQEIVSNEVKRSLRKALKSI